jgi:hypothetical protein
MAELKTKPTRRSVSAYLAAIPDADRRRDARTLSLIMQEVSGEKPVLWGGAIVGFGRYHYKYASGHEGETALIGFAPRKDRLTIYLLDGFDGRGEQLARLGKHSKGKSCLHIKRLDDVDVKVLRQMLKSSVTQMRKRPSR